MKIGTRLFLLMGCLAAAPPVARAEWQAVETVQTYTITGTSGAELYASIGEQGPKVGGNVRAIAHTSFKLTWTRKYEPQGNACVLVSARPKLTLIYTLPKPSGRLSEPTSTQWKTFITGVRDHERVHGEIIEDMVRQIEAASVGLSVDDDPGCRKIRTELTSRLAVLSRAQRQKSRDFDRVEMSEGGNIRQLVIRLVTGR